MTHKMMPPFALYIHWPFCLAKCPYCDFNSHVLAADEAAYVNGLLNEMQYWAERIGTRNLTSIFFGGGTPSLLSPASVSKLIENANKYWPFTENIEITLEANPTSSEAEKFQGFYSAGVNRLSLGVQALDDAALHSLGRKHNVDEALSAVCMAQNIFPRTSFDLIYARKGQTTAAWEKELSAALKVARGHLSLYQLTIEPGTVFARQAATGTEHRADDGVASEMYALTQNMTKAAGLPAYEVSNHAEAGQECRHNLSYWHYDDYLGIGPGAHGRISCPYAENNGEHPRESGDPMFIPAKINGTPAGAGMSKKIKHATACIKPPQQWLKQVLEADQGMEINTPLTTAEMRDEALLMGLRLTRGIDKQKWLEKFHASLDDALNLPMKKACITEGLLKEDETSLRATADGMMKLTSLTAALSKI